MPWASCDGVFQYFENLAVCSIPFPSSYRSLDRARSSCCSSTWCYAPNVPENRGLFLEAVYNTSTSHRQWKSIEKHLLTATPPSLLGVHSKEDWGIFRSRSKTIHTVKRPRDNHKGYKSDDRDQHKRDDEFLLHHKLRRWWANLKERPERTIINFAKHHPWILLTLHLTTRPHPWNICMYTIVHNADGGLFVVCGEKICTHRYNKHLSVVKEVAIRPALQRVSQGGLFVRQKVRSSWNFDKRDLECQGSEDNHHHPSWLQHFNVYKLLD